MSKLIWTKFPSDGWLPEQNIIIKHTNWRLWTVPMYYADPDNYDLIIINSEIVQYHSDITAKVVSSYFAAGIFTDLSLRPQTHTLYRSYTRHLLKS